MKKVEIERVRTGNFNVYVDGKLTYYIFNADMGASGRGGNMYGIENISTGWSEHVGSLAKCKKTVTFWANSK